MGTAEALVVSSAVAAMVGVVQVGRRRSVIERLRRELHVVTNELGQERSHLEAIEAEDGSRRHQLRNGLAAIGGTAWLLAHHDHALDAGTRTQLIEGLTGEVRRLQQLLEGNSMEGAR